MGILKDCINNKETGSIPIWFMRQAGRYLPEFREIRSKNTNFIKLCLNNKLSKEITLQPLKRFELDAAIIFSDILLIPYALNQEVIFEKNFGPKLGGLDIKKTLGITKNNIKKKLNPVYKLIKETSEEEIIRYKDLIGFVGGTWTILLYMLNKKSPKKLSNEIYELVNQDELIKKIVETQKFHIKKQVESGSTIIQIFDSWAGLLNKNRLHKYLYEPTKEIVSYTKSLGVETICFPRNIKSYKEFCDEVQPSAISIDYNINPENIANSINLPIQGGMDPKVLLADKETIKKEAKRYLDIFKDHQYIFNLGHGVLPETEPDMINYLVKFVKNY
tara:strand:- start:2647 stop:3642 length:996 start_codon:yes stop_codon:yes gene_type:complete